MGINISNLAFIQILAEAAASPDKEICGLLFGEGRAISAIHPCANIASDPSCEFEIDPAQLIAAHRAARHGGPQIIGHYHSHPNGLGEPSQADRLMIGKAGEIWIIIASGNARAFVANPDQTSFTETVLNGLER